MNAQQITIPLIQQMKREGKKSIGIVAWDFPTTRFADIAGLDFVSIGDSVGADLWGHDNPLQVTLDEILVCCKAVRRATSRMLVSCDMPYGPMQEGLSSAMKAAVRIVKEGGADMIKLDAAANHPDIVREMAQTGIPIFAQFGFTPQTALKYGIPYSAQNSAAALAMSDAAEKLVEEAKTLEACGAVALDFTNSGPVAGKAVAEAVKIPCIGGFGGGPWLDGRVRLAQTVLGYGEKWIGSKTETYFNTAQGTIDAFRALADDCRAGKQIRG